MATKSPSLSDGRNGGFRRPAGIRIVIVDEHRLLREVLGEVLLAEDDFYVLTDSTDVESSIALIARTRPDIVLIDIDKPNGSPGGVVRRLREASPRSVVAVLSMYDDARIVQEMIRAGVRCYLHKGITRRDLVASLRSVAGTGEQVTLTVPQATIANLDAGYAGPLSRREREVIALVGAAMSNRQIATHLSVTEGTVKRHLRNIFHKLGAVSRIDAVNKYKALADANTYPWSAAGM
ncbi:response regulator transcription factor [Nonomuraea sp. MG754425]|nr:response regulator transcription factor [Nonomuraea sp. MG754425]